MPGESSTGTPPTVQHVDIMDDTREQLRSIDDAFNLPMPRLERCLKVGEMKNAKYLSTLTFLFRQHDSYWARMQNGQKDCKYAVSISAFYSVSL